MIDVKPGWIVKATDERGEEVVGRVVQISSPFGWPGLSPAGRRAVLTRDDGKTLVDIGVGDPLEDPTACYNVRLSPKAITQVLDISGEMEVEHVATVSLNGVTVPVSI